MQVGGNEDILNGWLHSRKYECVVTWDTFMIDGLSETLYSRWSVCWEIMSSSCNLPCCDLGGWYVGCYWPAEDINQGSDLSNSVLFIFLKLTGSDSVLSTVSVESQHKYQKKGSGQRGKRLWCDITLKYQDGFIHIKCVQSTTGEFIPHFS